MCNSLIPKTPSTVRRRAGAEKRPWACRSPGGRTAALRSAGQCPLEPAAIFAVSVKRVLPGGKLHPDLMRPPGVECDLRKAQGTVRCRLYDAVFQHGFPHPLAGALYRKDPALPAVLEQIVPQDALRRQLFVRPACDHGPVCFAKAGLCRCTGASLCPAVQNGIGLLALRHLFCQSRCGSGCSGIDHQPETPVSSRWMTQRMHPACPTAGAGQRVRPPRWSARRACPAPQGQYLRRECSQLALVQQGLELEHACNGLAVLDLAAHHHLIGLGQRYPVRVRNSSASRCIRVSCRPVATQV